MSLSQQLAEVKDRIDILVADEIRTGDAAEGEYIMALNQLLAKLYIDASTLCSEQKNQGACASIDPGVCTWTPGTFHIGGKCTAGTSSKPASSTTRVEEALQDYVGPEIRRLEARRKSDGRLEPADQKRLLHLKTLDTQLREAESSSKKYDHRLKELDHAIQEVEDQLEACRSDLRTCGPTEKRRLDRHKKKLVEDRRRHMETWTQKLKTYAPTVLKALVVLGGVATAGWGASILFNSIGTMPGLWDVADKARHFASGGYAAGKKLVKYLKGEKEEETNNNSWGTVVTVGSMLAPFVLSDIRCKYDITPITHGPDVRLYRFKYKKKFRRHYGYDRGYHIGVLAQEVQSYYPDCTVDIDGLLHVDYVRLARILL